MITFESPLFFIAAIIFLIVYGFFAIFYRERSYIFPTLEVAKPIRGTLRTLGARYMVILRLIAIVLIVVALARPQIQSKDTARREGIAIVLAIDCSSTMLAEDLQLGHLGLARLVDDGTSSVRMNRLEAVKKVAGDFVRARSSDMIGIVAFAAQAYVLCPPTYDSDWLSSSLDRIAVGIIKDGTAIGSGILSSLDALKDVKARSKVIILLTDGINNFGEVPPLVASKAARAMGVKIYTIGIAGRGQVPYPVKDAQGNRSYKNMRIDLDESALRKVADTSGGVYFRASDMAALKDSYNEIDRLERSVMDETSSMKNVDVFQYAVLAALLLIVLELVLSNTYFRKIP